MFRLTVSNGTSIDASNYKTYEEAGKAMADSYKKMGEDYDEDASYFGYWSAFHMGQDECNVFDISEIPDEVRDMSAEQILDAISDDVKMELYEALQREMENEREREL